MKATLVGLGFALSIFALDHSAEAAAIAWQTPVDETGTVSDIVNAGTLVAAGYVGDTPYGNTASSADDVTLNGVTFSKQLAMDATYGPTENFADSSLMSLHNITNVQGYSFNNAPGGWNPAYRTLVSGADFSGASNNPYIEVAGLTVGQSYLVQMLMPEWNSNYGTTISDGVGNTSAILNLGNGGTVPQYVIGTFIADASTQDFYLGGGYSGNTAFFGAAQVRTAGDAAPAPEPASLALIAGGIAGIAALRRRK